MNLRRLRLFALTAFLLVALSAANFAYYASDAQESKSSTAFAGDLSLKGIADYKQWTRVTEVPLPVSLSLVSTSSSLFAGG